MSTTKLSFWEKLAALATIVQAIVVVLTIMLIQSQLDVQTDQLKLQTQQLQLQTKLTSAANVQSLAALALPINLDELNNAQTAKLWLTGAKGFQNKHVPTEQEIQQDRYKTLLATWLIFYENMFYQHGQGLLAREVFEPWDEDLKDFVIESNLKEYWPQMRASYHEKFGKHVDQIITDAQAAQKDK